MKLKSFIKPRVQIKNTRTSGDSYLVYPEYLLTGNDLMMKGGKFYAVLDPETNLWVTDKTKLYEIIDSSLYKYADEHYEKEINDFGEPEYYIQGPTKTPVYISSLENSGTNRLHELNSWMKDLGDNHNFHPLDSDLTFLDQEVLPEQYRSKRLPYKLSKGSIEAYDKMMSVLYLPDERKKLEWAIGAILSGDSKSIEKMIVIFGGPGTGKSTVLDLIKNLFIGYTGVFSASDLGNKQSQFATALFKDNPLVMIQDDGSLAKIDSPIINEIISHKETIINEKGKAQYPLYPLAMLFLATNDPVDIRDTNLGISRRLLDVQPTNQKLPVKEYRKLYHKMMNEEISAIAYHCLEVYEKMGKEYYLPYVPREMISRTNYIWNFIDENLDLFLEKDPVRRDDLYDRYKFYVDQSNIPYPLNKVDFTNKMKEYYRVYNGWDKATRIGDKVSKNVFSGFKIEKMHYKEQGGVVLEPWLVFDQTVSNYNDIHALCQAQYDTGDPDNPLKESWAKCKTILNDIDARKVHWIRPPANEIVVDFDYEEDGKKSLSKNLKEALKWPETYAELSKSGGGIHLHYYFNGDLSEIQEGHISDKVEIKIFPEGQKRALRRKMTKCNDIPIMMINSSYLPKRKEKKQMVDMEAMKSEKIMRKVIKDCLAKKHHGATKPEVDFIKKILDDAYDSGATYDLSDLQPAVMAFAANSSNHSLQCLKIVNQMYFKSEDMNTVKDEEEKPIIFYDIEVFPNLFLVNWKYQGDDKKVVRMINPTATEIEDLVSNYRLIGFNNRRYDNHIMYARMQGYSLEGLYSLSQKIVASKKGDKVLFGPAYNLSYADVYDFSTDKKSLKKWEIELGIHHQELGLPWDQPVPEEMWEKVAEYCDNDVIATEAVFNHCHADFIARQILADISGLTVNDTTNKQTETIIFGKDKVPQTAFVYTDLSKEFPGYTFDHGESHYRGEITGEGGYVYAEPGMYFDVALLDIASMHPTSIEVLNLFGRYTRNFSAIKQARILIKHGEFDEAGKLFDGRLAKYLTNKEDADALAFALKIAINSVYGLTSASFENKFRDPRNIDNIVAKRGALFMINLKHEVQERGFTVAHIKTDSIKIPDATPEIISFVMDYGKQYGYTFEHEATYSEMCLVNDAVYIARYADGKHAGEWTATGAEFQHPYIFKDLFSKEPIEFKDLCETKTVSAGDLYLDMNENLKEGEHDYKFVGRAGSFCPIKPGGGGGILLRINGEKIAAASNTKGWRWLEAEDVKGTKMEESIDMDYFGKLVDDAVTHINEFGDFDAFVSGEGRKNHVPSTWPKIDDDEELPFAVDAMNPPVEAQ